MATTVLSGLCQALPCLALQATAKVAGYIHDLRYENVTIEIAVWTILREFRQFVFISQKIFHYRTPAIFGCLLDRSTIIEQKYLLN